MGVDAADFDDDGDVDLFATHLASEGMSLWRNDGAGGFQDIAAVTPDARGDARSDRFGASWFDPDSDGALDMAVVNGAVRIVDRMDDGTAGTELGEPNLLLGARGERYEDVSLASGISTDPGDVDAGSSSPISTTT